MQIRNEAATNQLNYLNLLDNHYQTAKSLTAKVGVINSHIDQYGYTPHLIKYIEKLFASESNALARLNDPNDPISFQAINIKLSYEKFKLQAVNNMINQSRTLFCNISELEFLNIKTDKPSIIKKECPAYVAWVSHFNNSVNYIVSDCFNSNNQHEFRLGLQRWLEALNTCFVERSFNDAQIICDALLQANITKHIDHLDEKYKDIYQTYIKKIEDDLSSADQYLMSRDNFKMMRDHMIEDGFIPFMPVFFHDVTRAEETARLATTDVDPSEIKKSKRKSKNPIKPLSEEEKSDILGKAKLYELSVYRKIMSNQKECRLKLAKIDNNEWAELEMATLLNLQQYSSLNDQKSREIIQSCIAVIKGDKVLTTPKEIGNFNDDKDYLFKIKGRLSKKSLTSPISTPTISRRVQETTNTPVGEVDPTVPVVKIESAISAKDQTSPAVSRMLRKTVTSSFFELPATKKTIAYSPTITNFNKRGSLLEGDIAKSIEAAKDKVKRASMKLEDDTETMESSLSGLKL